MGLLDQIIGAVTGGSGNQTGQQSPLLPLILALLNNQQSGGLAGLIRQFQQKGLGNEAASWIGTGQNMPVSADQISNVFGGDTLNQYAQQSGMSNGQVSGGLAELLPAIIDKLTPHGQLPEQNAVPGDLNQLLGKLLTH